MEGGEKFATSALDPDFTFRAINVTLYGRNNNKERQFERLSLSLCTWGRRPTDGPPRTGRLPKPVNNPASIGRRRRRAKTRVVSTNKGLLGWGLRSPPLTPDQRTGIDPRLLIA